MKKFAAILLTVLLLAAMIPFSAITAFAATADNVQFYRRNEATNNLEPDTRNGCVVADETLSDIGVGYADWVIVNDNVQIVGLNVYGEANIILAEGGELAMEYICGCGDANVLHIYGTSADGKGGTLRLNGEDSDAVFGVNIDLCGGSLIVEEGYENGISGEEQEIAVHGGSMSIQAGAAGVSGSFRITGGSAEITAKDNYSTAQGIIGDLIMEGGELKITASFAGINGNAAVYGGELYILAGDEGIYNGVLTFDDNIGSIHIAVNTSKMPGSGSDDALVCREIAGNHDNVILFKGSGEWESVGTFKDNPRTSLDEFNEVLLLPAGSENPSFSPDFAGSTLSSGNVTIICAVAVAAVGAFAAAYFVAKKKKQPALADDSED